MAVPIENPADCEVLFVFCRPMRSYVILSKRQVLAWNCSVAGQRKSAYARQTQALLREQFHWDIFEHPPYSPDLATSDIFLFPKMKDHLAGKSFSNDEDLKDAVVTWLSNQAATWYEEGIYKLVQRYGMCL